MESNAVSPTTVCSNETEQAQQKEGLRRESGKQSIYEQVTDRILKSLPPAPFRGARRGQAVCPRA